MPEQEKSTPNQPGVKGWSSVAQTFTADHQLNQKQAAIEQNRWPRIWAPPTTPKKETNS